jgi:FMN phosphatase YigB (HAD superfamily)
MKVAIVHYHLGDGGVAAVIRGICRVLGDAGIGHVVLAGEAADPASDPPPMRVVAGLGYARHGAEAPAAQAADSAEQLLRRMQAAAADALGAAPDLWHIHNHALGKNPLLTSAVALLARSGAAILLQTHDLAEDGRADLYARMRGIADRYPHGPRVRHAFLNRRDLDCFLDAGLPACGAELLANPVAAPDCGIGIPNRGDGDAVWFVPSRGIRRKNIGELLLLAACLPPDVRIAVSQAPRNPGELARYRRWTRFSETLGLPILWEVSGKIVPEGGADSSFASWLARSTHILSTSVAEGFCLPFVESAGWGRPFIGRRIAPIAEIHAASGLRHRRLYDRIETALDEEQRKILRESIASAWRRHLAALALPGDSSSERVLFQGREGEDGFGFDFANFPERLQRAVIAGVRGGSCAPPRVIDGSSAEDLPSWLRRVVADRTAAEAPPDPPWSPPRFGRRLVALYRDIAAAPRDAPAFLDPEKVLAPRLHPGAVPYLLLPPEPPRYRAVILDVYGTLLDVAGCGVSEDPAADPALREIIRRNGWNPPALPSRELHEAVLRHHAASGSAHPEVDLRELWREVLGLPPDLDLTGLVVATERAWHPAKLFAGTEETLASLAGAGVALGLMSNAQCNTLLELGAAARWIRPELSVLSYLHRVAKPSAELYRILVDRLAVAGFLPGEVLFVGNDPAKDIIPASACGFATVWFQPAAAGGGSGQGAARYRIGDLRELVDILF